MGQVQNIEKEVRELIADIIEMGPEAIQPDVHLVEDLGMDSMMALEILAALEKKFHITIPEEELATLTTLSRAVELVKKYAQ